MDIRLALMCGTDIPVPECQLIVHQPMIKDISFIGEQDFFKGVQTFCVNKNLVIQDKNVLDNTNNFQIFMTMISEKETADKKFAVQQINSLFFPEYKVSYTPRSIIFSKGAEVNMIDENNFEFLQNVLSQICCLRQGPDGQGSFNPQSEKAREIAQKLMRGRERVAQLKGENNSSIFSQYLSVLTIGLNSMTLKDVMDLTIYQMYDLIERYLLYIHWDMDIRSRLAGAKPESKPDDWMKNIH